MQFPDTAGANGRPATLPRHVGVRSELDRLRATCRSQAPAIDALGEAVSALRRGAAALKTENAERERLRGVLDNAQLLVSELVTNSVRHSGACPAEAVIVRVSPSRTMVRIQVEDAGRGGAIAPRAPDLDSGGGFGLQLVQALSERWGRERVADGGTIVWAQLPRTPVTAPASTGEPAAAGRARPSLTQINRRAGGRRATPAGGQP